MNILYYSVHQILEDDECRLFQQLGHNVICLGANGKNGSVQAFRPAIEFSPAEVALYDKFAELGGRFVYGADITSTIIPADFMDFIDVTVVMHDPQFIARFWDTISAKPVVWRTIGQGIDMIDAALLRVLAAGAAAGIAVGIHCPSGEVAAARFAAGFTWASIASDLTHLEQAARDHLGASGS